LLTFCFSVVVLTGSLAYAQGAPQGGKPAPELFLAIGQGDAGAVKALLAGGADPNAHNTLGMSALMIASGTGRLDVVRTLVDAGANVRFDSPFGSPLFFAAYGSDPAVMRLLLEKGAAVTSQRADRITVLMLAARAGSPDVVRQILAKKPDVAAADNHGSTALSYAARSGHTDVARLLIAAGAKVDVPDLDGWTPLMHAAVNGHSGVTRLLIEKGASVKVRDKQGKTPLLLAAGYGDHPEVVRDLVHAKAELEAGDQKGRTALALAEARGFSGTAKVLRDGGARAPARATPARTPRAAAEAGLRQVEHSMQTFAKRTGCVSCHHEGIARFTTGFARGRGYAINNAFALEQEKRVLGQFEQLRPLLDKAVQNPAETKHVPIVDVGDLAPTNGTLLLGLAEHQVKGTETLGAATMVLARTQTPDGDWRFGLLREPVQSSYFTMTAMTVRAMRTYAPKAFAGEIEGRVTRAKQWLQSAPTRSTEDQVFRLLGLQWSGATAEERRKAIDELRAAQRPDGGWAQLPTTASDAYATGSALFALAQAGDLPVKDPVYQRGVQFLLRTQEDDGTWYVYKRAIPGNNYFDADFPYGQSQYASHAAACWATLALILADSPASS